MSSSEPLWIGILYAVLIFLNTTLESVILGGYFHRMFRLGMHVRTALVSAIYKKVSFLPCLQHLSDLQILSWYLKDISF